MTLAISLSLINLALYCIQQLGVTLGVGAETTLLVAYLQSMRDGVIDEKEQGFARAVRRVKDMGLFLMIISGIGIVGTQFLAGQLSDFFSVIVWFKWSLIGIVLFMTFIVRGYSITAGLLQGLSAGTWYALFAVHILAPTASWLQLGIFYALWLVGFCVCWTMLVFALRGKPGSAPRTLQPAVAAKLKTALPLVKPAGQGAPAASLSSPLTRIEAGSPAPPVMSRMPKQNPSAVPQNRSAGFAQAPSEQKLPVQPKPQPPVSPAPTPPPPPKSAPALPATTSISPIWLHVMPKTPEELAKHKEQRA